MVWCNINGKSFKRICALVSFISGLYILYTLKSFADVYYDRSKTKGHPSASYYLVDGLWVLKGDRKLPLEKRKHIPSNGDVIFIKTDFLERIAGTFLARLNTSFILITHNSAFSVPRGSKSMQLLDHPKLIRWFAQNPRINHPNLEAIPIGLENQRFHYAGFLPNLEKSFKLISRIYDPADTGTHRTKPNTLYLNFNPTHNNIRYVAQHYLIKMGYQKSEIKPLLEYHRDLGKSRFVVSPPGVGEDCHRTWEAILFGTIPIVWNSTLWNLFQQSPY
ncbi:hypothetical protein TCAL_11519 [Tigriopus californicus]|uniref:Exostosin GT47 domain-containing protein n=1 Tax=Tigriopus californicus TaxID=6832 RepID=A0A553P8Q4_TIGCA|nr:hypothetical protein TCAL_11519 [Tigriopus californicus]